MVKEKLEMNFYKMKSQILALLVSSASATKLHDSDSYFNEPAFHDRIPVDAGFIQLEISVLLTNKVDGIICFSDVFTQDSPGFNGLV